MYREENKENHAQERTKPDEFKNIKYFFKENFKDECDAFIKYFAAIERNGILSSLIKEVENMGDYCELFSDVNRDFFKYPVNAYHVPIPPEELSTDILHASNLVRLINLPDKKRSLIAHTVIPINKVLICEPPVVLQVKPLCTCVGDRQFSLYRCHNCGIACKMFFTCDGCNVCVFCSRTCLLDAYANYHRYECYGLQRHFWSMEDTDYAYLALRMMLYGASKDFKNDPIMGMTYGNPKNNYPYVYMLETHFHRLSVAKINEILYSSARNVVYLARKTTFFDSLNDKGVNKEDLHLYVGGLMVRHNCQARINNIIIKYPNLPAGIGIDIVSGAGKAICPTVALLNHSCSPNAAIMIYYDSVVVKSTRTINPGQEITICYAEVNALLTLPERELIVEEIFHFKCKCYFCEYERNWAEAPYKCQACKIGKAKKIVLENKRVTGHCVRCKRYFSFDDIAENLKVAAICQNLYKATYSIEHVTRLAECYSNIFPTNSWKLLDIYKLLYEKHVLGAEKPLEAVKYGIMMFQILEHYVSRLYLPILIAKVSFVHGILAMTKFKELQVLTEDELPVMKIFVSEVIKMQRDLEFYLSEQRITFHQNILIEVHKIFQSLEVL